MALVPTRPEQFIESQELLRAEGRRHGATPTVSVKNAPLAADLLRPQYLEFRRRRFLVPPISYELGIELQHIAARIEQLESSPILAEEDRAREFIANCKDAVILFWKAVVPANWFTRLFWRWRGNPFGNATLGEVAELLGFFLPCRMRSSVRPLGSKRVRHRLLLMPPTPSAGLFDLMDDGSTTVEFPLAGDITS